MGDGVAPAALVKKRNEADIARFEANLVQQELEIMELEQRIHSLKTNIEATKKEIRRKQDSIAALVKQRGHELEEVDDG